MRFARLIDRPVRVLGGPAVRAAYGGISACRFHHAVWYGIAAGQRAVTSAMRCSAGIAMRRPDMDREIPPIPVAPTEPHGLGERWIARR
jgi:hypothetical protein